MEMPSQALKCHFLLPRLPSNVQYKSGSNIERRLPTSALRDRESDSAQACKPLASLLRLLLLARAQMLACLRGDALGVSFCSLVY